MPLLREMLLYWQGLCQEGRLPGRKDLEPAKIPNILPWMLILDVVPSGADYRFKFRLFGTGLVERAGRELTGLWFEEAFPADEQQAYFIQGVNRVVREKQPLGFYGHSMIQDRKHVRVAGLILPLADDGETVDRLISVNLRQEVAQG
ncbi:MAG: PAS domain-containing protein [Alphaproteobacteria bacterium]|nr:PAS domain-containing protein [Alphaproteobacteria bacterium]MDP6563409.1 PAS domain-containing protein [Alphaproteobacteria bacterium]MDP6812860.1 PAS domain-containing protein [Alphaproteobacteria bacterium]